jgi:hypothetical protein
VIRYTATAKDLEVLDKVRRNPQFYLSPGRTPVLNDVAVEMASDALYLGGSMVTIAVFQDWYVVSCSSDWIVKESRWSVPEVFFRLQIFHGYRKNATRATVLLPAFFNDVVTIGGDEAIVVKGCDESIDDLLQFIHANASGIARSVAFRGSSV